MKKFFLLFLLCLSIQVKPVVILVHGTFAASSDWHHPQGAFFQKLEEEARLVGEHVVPFRWSGGSSHAARLSAGQKLAKLILNFNEEKIILIGHSHGGNIINIASSILAKEKSQATRSTSIKPYRIDHVYLLATPIDSQQYPPNMDVIGTLCNLYSKKDWVQSAFGLYEQCLKKHERITNLQVIIHHDTIKKHPSHSQMHHPIIAQWLLTIPFQLVDQKTISFEKFNWNQDGIIYLDSYNKPYYEMIIPQTVQKERPHLIASAA